jgi:glyoxalase family protein
MDPLAAPEQEGRTAMTTPTTGLHHVTAVAGDPQRNLDFYSGLLGLRLVKRTVNFDDPGTYHFYYGDRTGRPGTLLTFFPWAGMRRGRRGAGETARVSYSVPPTALAYWEERLGQKGVLTRRSERFGVARLGFEDPDGMALELAADGELDPSGHWEEGGVPAAAAIRRFSGVSLLVRNAEPTAAVVTELLGLTPGERDGALQRFVPASGGPGGVEIREDPSAGALSFGAGSIHHIAWRAADQGHQLAFRGEVVNRGLHVTPVVDRNYFRSIYFREPGGVLFEVATDDPGFLIDEPERELGRSLKLPPQYESERAAIEAVLPAIRVPGTDVVTAEGGR